MSVDKPTVHVVATGGTIANPPDVDGYLLGEELVSDIPEVGAFADVQVTDVASCSSQALSPDHLFDLHDQCMNVADSDDPADGIVVTSGSNANEEIAYFLNLTLETNVPVVTTAAQRNHGTIGNDGDRNLLDAIRVATSPHARGRGVLTVVSDQIHAARDVRKVVSSRPDAWSSGDHGVLGRIDKRGRVQFSRQVERLHTKDTVFDPASYHPDALRDIKIIYSSLGDDGTIARAAVQNGADGLVVAGFPTGTPAEPTTYEGQGDVLEQIIEEGVPVVMSHRGFNGWTYAYSKTEYDVPYLAADDLSPAKARILLYLGLQETGNIDDIQEYYDKY